jgi:hypothetical protein
MVAYADASRTPLDQAAPLPEMHAAERVLLIAASVLSIGTGFVLLLWAAEAVRERN